MSVLKGPEGDYSSKRAVGLSYAFLGVVMVLFSLIANREINIEVLLVVVGTGLTSLGISSKDYLSYKKNPSIQVRGTVDPDPLQGPRDTRGR